MRGGTLRGFDGLSNGPAHCAGPLLLSLQNAAGLSLFILPIPASQRISYVKLRFSRSSVNLAQHSHTIFLDDIKSPMGNDLWSAGTVRSILRNEKYCGDALMQKTYTKDFRTHKSVKNTDLNMYFKENHHTAIIKKEDWIKVQKLLSERHSTAKRATLRRLSNHFVAYRVKDGLFKGYLIMDSRWSFMERQEFMKIVGEAQNTMK